MKKIATLALCVLMLALTVWVRLVLWVVYSVLVV